MTRVALEIVGQSGLGYSFETLDETKSNQYAAAVKMLLCVLRYITHSFYSRCELTSAWINSPAFGAIPILRQVLPYVCNLGTPSFRRWAVRFLPSKNVQLLIKATNAMDETSKKIFYLKKAALEKGDDAVVQQIGEGRDIMSVLSELCLCYEVLTWTKMSESVVFISLVRSNLNAHETDRMPDHELLGQMS